MFPPPYGWLEQRQPEMSQEMHVPDWNLSGLPVITGTEVPTLYNAVAKIRTRVTWGQDTGTV